MDAIRMTVRVEHPQDVTVHCHLCPEASAGMAAGLRHLRDKHPGVALKEDDDGED